MLELTDDDDLRTFQIRAAELPSGGYSPTITSLSILYVLRIGAGGRTRTDTAFYGPRILSPVCLPFHHTGNADFIGDFVCRNILHLRVCPTFCPAVSRMKQTETLSDTVTKPAGRRPNAWNRVFNDRKQHVRGLWERNALYYAQLKIDGRPIRFKLDHATTVPQAVEEMQALKQQRREKKTEATKQREIAKIRNGKAHDKPGPRE